MDATQVCTSLVDPQLEKTIREALASWDNPPPGEIDLTIKWIMAQRDELVTLLGEIEDPDDVAMTVAIHYIELKSRWIAFNTKVNYQTFRVGRCEARVAMRASACSLLLGKVESLLSQSDIEKITEFLARPIAPAV